MPVSLQKNITKSESNEIYIIKVYMIHRKYNTLREWFTYFDIPFFSLLYHWKTPIEYYISNKLFIAFFLTAVNTSTCFLLKSRTFS